MKTLHVLIGNNDDELSYIASQMYKNSFLVTDENFYQVQFDTKGCAYTSIADLSEEKITELALKALCVHYMPPTNEWSSAELETSTKSLLTKLSQQFGLKIKNFVFNVDPTNSLIHYDQRKTQSPQLWAVGCSFAYGFGLQVESQRYIEIVAKELQLDYSDLTSPGSSISWAADQILRADICSGDTVIWGITGINRVDYYINNEYCIVPSAVVGHYGPRGQQKFFKKLITDDNRLNQAVKSLYQVVNFVNKVGARLIVLDHSKELSLYEHSKVFKEYLWGIDSVIEPAEQVDSTDDNHPGPVTNQLWADQIIKFIKEGRREAYP